MLRCLAMTTREFAAKYRLRVNDLRLAGKHRVRIGEDVVLGRYGEITEIGGAFRVRLFATPRDSIVTGALRGRYRAALAAGLTCMWKSEAESIFLFDPTSAAQVALVVKLVAARYRRQGRPVTPEQLERLTRAREGRFSGNSLGKSGAPETNHPSVSTVSPSSELEA